MGLKGISLWSNLLLCTLMALLASGVRANHDFGSGPSVYLNQLNRVTDQAFRCSDIRSMHVLDFHVTLGLEGEGQNEVQGQQNTCTCSVSLPESQEPTSVTVSDDKGKLMIDEKIWGKWRALPLHIDGNTIHVSLCGMHYERHLPASITIGGEKGMMLTCWPGFDRLTEEQAQSEEDLYIEKTEDSFGRRMTGILTVVILIGVVFINLAVTLSIKFGKRLRRPAPLPHDQNPASSRQAPIEMKSVRRTIYKRQHTTTSHPYESILVDDEEELNELNAGMLVISESNVRNAPAPPPPNSEWSTLGYYDNSRSGSRNKGVADSTTVLDDGQIDLNENDTFLNNRHHSNTSSHSNKSGLAQIDIDLQRLREEDRMAVQNSSVDLDMPVYPPSTCYDRSSCTSYDGETSVADTILRKTTYDNEGGVLSKEEHSTERCSDGVLQKKNNFREHPLPAPRSMQRLPASNDAKGSSHNSHTPRNASYSYIYSSTEALLNGQEFVHRKLSHPSALLHTCVLLSNDESVAKGRGALNGAVSMASCDSGYIERKSMCLVENCESLYRPDGTVDGESRHLESEYLDMSNKKPSCKPCKGPVSVTDSKGYLNVY